MLRRTVREADARFYEDVNDRDSADQRQNVVLQSFRTSGHLGDDLPLLRELRTEAGVLPFQLADGSVPRPRLAAERLPHRGFRFTLPAVESGRVQLMPAQDLSDSGARRSRFLDDLQLRRR